MVSLAWARASPGLACTRPRRSETPLLRSCEDGESNSQFTNDKVKNRESHPGMWSPGDRFFLGVGFLPRCFLSLCRFLPPRTSWKKYIVHLSNLFERLSHCEVSGPRLPLVLRAGAPAKNRRLLSTSNRKCPHVLQLLLAVRSKMLYHPYHLP